MSLINNFKTIMKLNFECIGTNDSLYVFLNLLIILFLLMI